MPDVCTVVNGDTFESISERMYGDASFADLIADNNGYRVDDLPQPGLTPGLTLQMPNIVRPTHNWEGVYPVIVAWVKRSGTRVLLEGIARTRGLYGSQRRYV